MRTSKAVKLQTPAAWPGDAGIWLSLPLSELRLPQTRNGFNRSTSCRFACLVGRLPPCPPSLLSPASALLYPQEAEGSLATATSLSYTRNITFAQGFIHDLSRSIRSGGETDPQRTQRRNRRQTQEIPMAVGNQLLPAAASCRSWR